MTGPQAIPLPPGVAAPLVSNVAVQQALAAVTQNEPQHVVVNLANAVTGLYGLTGSGKSSLADTASDYAWRVHKATTLAYCADLGGFGAARLKQIRLGICAAWDPRNRPDMFATAQAMSLGAFPATLLPGGSATQSEREIGYAPPDDELVYPTRDICWYVCPQGHSVGRFDSQVELQRAQVACPQCGHLCHVTDPSVMVGSGTLMDPRFAHVGHRIYDSGMALNDWGLQKLPEMSGKGLVGKVLSSADALREQTGGGGREFVFGTGSEGQVGFMQNRTQEWIANIRSIAGAKVPPTMTFGVEMSKADDETGGQLFLGPKIAGRARTGAVGHWLGNLGHAERGWTEDNRPVHRLWLVNHYDPMDPRRIPYLAKHRGEPMGMPMFLEDPPLVDERGVYDPSRAWSTCSLGVLYDLLDKQVRTGVAELAKQYPDAPAFQPLPAVEEKIIVRTQAAPTGVTAAPGFAGAVVPAGVSAAAGGALAPAGPPMIGGGPAMRPPAPMALPIAPQAQPTQQIPTASVAAPVPHPSQPAPASTPGAIAGAATPAIAQPLPPPPSTGVPPGPRTRTPRPPTT